MPDCPRCERDVDRLRMIPPDATTSELIEATDHDQDAETQKEAIEVCHQCADEVLGE